MYDLLTKEPTPIPQHYKNAICRFEGKTLEEAVELGKIYYDYGEWLEPSDKYPGRGEYNLSGNIFDEMRFYETASALSNLLAKIPSDKMKNACFVGVCGRY